MELKVLENSVNIETLFKYVKKFTRSYNFTVTCLSLSLIFTCSKIKELESRIKELESKKDEGDK